MTDYESLKELMLTRFDALDEKLVARKEYWDSKINQICRSMDEMKEHCVQQEGQCGKVFEWYDKRMKECEKETAKNTNDISRIKTVGGIIVLLWSGIIAFGKHILGKLGG